VTEKNSDVERALSAYGGTSLKYHSFGQFTMHPRNQSDARVFTYNEMGEPEYTPLPEPSIQNSPTPTRHDPLFETPFPAPAPARVIAPIAAPVVMPPPAPPVSRTSPQPAIASRMPPRPPTPAPVVQAAAVAPEPPPPPFFPLLAAALPDATEPSYAPSYPAAPPPSYPQPNQVATTADVAAPMAQAGSAGTSADQRSLSEMFRLLAGRGEAAPTPNALPPAAAAPAEGQALFRRI
jgi:hypothetical protein